MGHRLLRAATCTAILLCAPATASAHASIDEATAGSLSKLAEDSNLVFLGEVAKVEYRNIQVYEGSAPIPHVFVTYRVQKTLRGKVGDLLTVRFVGGPDGQGNFLSVSGVPQFQPGDQDLLFMSNNGSETCPLVMCEYGRFRVSRERVYNGEGEPVRAVLNGVAVARGAPPAELATFSYPAPKFDDLIKNPEVARAMKQQGLSVDVARKRYEAGAPKTIQINAIIPPEAANAEGSDTMKAEETRNTETTTVPKSELPKATMPKTTKPEVSKRPDILARPEAEVVGAETKPLPEGAMALTEFMSNVQRVIATTKRQPTEIASIDPNAKVKLRRMVFSTPVVLSPGKLPQPAGPDDATERQRYDANGQNPVLGH